MNTRTRASRIEAAVRQRLMIASGLTEARWRSKQARSSWLYTFIVPALIGFILGLVVHIIFFAPAAQADSTNAGDEQPRRAQQDEESEPRRADDCSRTSDWRKSKPAADSDSAGQH